MYPLDDSTTKSCSTASVHQEGANTGSIQQWGPPSWETGRGGRHIGRMHVGRPSWDEAYHTRSSEEGHGSRKLGRKDVVTDILEG